MVINLIFTQAWACFPQRQKLITYLSTVYLFFRHSLNYLKMFSVAQKQVEAQLLNKWATGFVNASKASKAWQSLGFYTENQTNFSK